MSDRRFSIGDMVGKTYYTVYATDDELHFREGTDPGDAEVLFYHEQDCCENVSIKDIVGELGHLTCRPILLAEETSNRAEESGDSVTWTFYKFATVSGAVTVSWYGASNGYYSESVSVKRIPGPR